MSGYKSGPFQRLEELEIEVRALRTEVALARERLGPAGMYMLKELKHLREHEENEYPIVTHYKNAIETLQVQLTEALHNEQASATAYAEVKAELEVARGALKFYADSSNYKLRYIPKRAMEMPVVDDEGQRARDALSGAEPKSRG